MTARIWLGGRKSWIQTLKVYPEVITALRKALTPVRQFADSCSASGIPKRRWSKFRGENYDNINSNFHSDVNRENPAPDLAE
jgi:hypothetical protein